LISRASSDKRQFAIGREIAGAAMRKRTRARELALKILYKLDLLGEKPTAENMAYLTSQVKDASVLEFAKDLVKNTYQRKAELDGRISRIARNWHIQRMAIVDRNILRIAAYELLYREDVPEKVTINEAIELAKKYSTEDSGAFVNGILDKIREEKYEKG